MDAPAPTKPLPSSRPRAEEGKGEFHLQNKSSLPPPSRHGNPTHRPSHMHVHGAEPHHRPHHQHRQHHHHHHHHHPHRHHKDKSSSQSSSSATTMPLTSRRLARRTSADTTPAGSANQSRRESLALVGGSGASEIGGVRTPSGGKAPVRPAVTEADLSREKELDRKRSE